MSETNTNQQTIESRTASEVMQRGQDITIGGKTYSVAPPTVGTLILVSEAVAKIPRLTLNTETVVEDVLREAKNCRAIGDAMAVLILGSKRISANRRFPACLLAKRNEQKRLARRILDTASPREIQEALAELVRRMQLGDFFGLTTFLNGINMTKPTAEVER